MTATPQLPTYNGLPDLTPHKPRTLPYDVARCASTQGCPLAPTCLRSTDAGHPTYQTHSHFPRGDECHGFIENGE